MAKFIIDEWLFADLAGENGKDKIYQSFEFLTKLHEKCDKIVVVKGSEFDRKFWRFCKKGDPISRIIIKFYKEKIRFNSDKCLVIYQNQLQLLPQAISSVIKRDDQYLIKAYYIEKDSMIITTDESLKSILENHGISCALREVFLQTY